jgi:hypothetical protein
MPMPQTASFPSVLAVSILSKSSSNPVQRALGPDGNVVGLLVVAQQVPAEVGQAGRDAGRTQRGYQHVPGV